MFGSHDVSPLSQGSVVVRADAVYQHCAGSLIIPESRRVS